MPKPAHVHHGLGSLPPSVASASVADRSAQEPALPEQGIPPHPQPSLPPRGIAHAAASQDALDAPPCFDLLGDDLDAWGEDTRGQDLGSGRRDGACQATLPLLPLAKPRLFKRPGLFKAPRITAAPTVGSTRLARRCLSWHACGSGPKLLCSLDFPPPPFQLACRKTVTPRCSVQRLQAQPQVEMDGGVEDGGPPCRTPERPVLRGNGLTMSEEAESSPSIPGDTAASNLAEQDTCHSRGSSDGACAPPWSTAQPAAAAAAAAPCRGPEPAGAGEQPRPRPSPGVFWSAECGDDCMLGPAGISQDCPGGGRAIPAWPDRQPDVADEPPGSCLDPARFQEASWQGRLGQQPWWQRFLDFVPVELLRNGIDPRYGAGNARLLQAAGACVNCGVGKGGRRGRGGEEEESGRGCGLEFA